MAFFKKVSRPVYSVSLNAQFGVFFPPSVFKIYFVLYLRYRQNNVKNNCLWHSCKSANYTMLLRDTFKCGNTTLHNQNKPFNTSSSSKKHSKSFLKPWFEILKAAVIWILSSHFFRLLGINTCSTQTTLWKKYFLWLAVSIGSNTLIFFSRTPNSLLWAAQQLWWSIPQVIFLGVWWVFSSTFVKLSWESSSPRGKNKPKHKKSLLTHGHGCNTDDRESQCYRIFYLPVSKDYSLRWGRVLTGSFQVTVHLHCFGNLPEETLYHGLMPRASCKLLVIA